MERVRSCQANPRLRERVFSGWGSLTTRIQQSLLWCKEEQDTTMVSGFSWRGTGLLCRPNSYKGHSRGRAQELRSRSIWLSRNRHQWGVHSHYNVCKHTLNRAGMQTRYVLWSTVESISTSPSSRKSMTANFISLGRACHEGGKTTQVEAMVALWVSISNWWRKRLTKGQTRDLVI